MVEVNSMYSELLSYACFLCCFIPVWVFSIMGCQVLSGRGVAAVNDEYNFLEFVWTFLPTVAVAVLCALNVGSMVLPVNSPNYESVLIVGNQWYWNYIMESSEESYDSVMLDFTDCVDKPLRLVFKTPYELLVSSADVIHSFSLPDFNVKLDCIPGRINNVVFFPDRLGVFIGHCTELCGAGHAYMPVVLEVVSRKSFV